MLFLPYAVVRGVSFKLRRLDEAKARGLFLFVLWLVPFVFFTLSRSKGLAYMLPALAPAALLVARLFDEALPPRSGWARGLVANAWGAVAVLAFSGALVLEVFFVQRAYAELAPLGGYIVLLAVLLGAGAAAGLAALLLRRGWLLVGGLAAPVPVAVLLTMTTLPDVSGLVSWEGPGKFFSAEIGRRWSEGDRLVFYRGVSHSTSFYLRERPVFVACNVDVRFMAPEEYAGWVFEGKDAAALLGALSERAHAEGHRLFCTALAEEYAALVKQPDAPPTWRLAVRHNSVLFSDRPDEAAGSVGGATAEEPPE